MRNFAYAVFALASACAADPSSPGDDLEPFDPPGDLEKADGGAHYRASFCELFVDRVTPYVGSHAVQAFEVYLKTLNARLDSAIVEVGFRAQVRDARGNVTVDWQNYPAHGFPGASDYWEINLANSSDFGATVREGVFYVRTASNTTYWVNSASGGNFLFDSTAFSTINAAAGYRNSPNFSPDPARGIDTRSSDATRWLNPSSCQ